jgi:hypothetical protein
MCVAACLQQPNQRPCFAVNRMLPNHHDDTIIVASWTVPEWVPECDSFIGGWHSSHRWRYSNAIAAAAAAAAEIW